MSKLILVVTDRQDWAPFYPSEDVVTVDEYLAAELEDEPGPVRVINLCHSHKYLSYGYYCSLLAEARGHRVIPSVRTMNDLRRRSMYAIDVESLDQAVEAALTQIADLDTDELELPIFFGTTRITALQDVARQLFELFPSPILHVGFEKKKSWSVVSVNIGSITKLPTGDVGEFAEALERFSTRIWMRPPVRKSFRYDFAMLVNPDEDMAPSDEAALRRFETVGRDMGLLVERIRKKDYGKVAEYDALFIRETTAINHHTFRFAKRAESEGMVVIDDPTSIMRCTNKLFLWDLLKHHDVASPRSAMLYRTKPEQLAPVAEALQFPIVVKVPDGSFSRGIVLAEHMEELRRETRKLFERSALLLAQEFVFTEFDWRVGILNRKPLFASKYFMAPSHWQIYNHAAGNEADEGGGFETVPISTVPSFVLDAALRAADLVGDGLYGVDLKQFDERAVVIEVNDNPNIDHGVEDVVLGDVLYEKILGEMVRRLDRKRAGDLY